MHYFVTGGAGFIGSHLSRALVSAGHDVTVMDNFSTGRRENVQDLESLSSFELVESDGSDLALLEKLITRADVVFHLAAAVGVQLVIDQPIKTLETNIDLAQSILRLCSQSDTRVLLASTSEVYGRGTQEWFREGDDLLIGPPTSRRWGYAASKLVDEFLSLAYHHEKQLPVTILRLFNTVGPGQIGRYGMVIPRFVRKALLGETLSVYGDGKQRRTFTSVEQVVKAMMELVDCDASIGSIINLGGSAEVSIENLAKRIIELTQSQSGVEHIPYEEAYGEAFDDMRRRNPDTAQLKGLIGWAPDASLEDILNPVIEHMRESISKEAP